MPISLENNTNVSIENNTNDVVNNQLLCLYSADGHYENSVECGMFVFTENCLFKIGQNDITNTFELVSCSKTTNHDVKILNLTFTNSQPDEMSISDVGYLCSNVMNAICFGDSVAISDFVLSSIAATDVDASSGSGNNLVSDNKIVLQISAFSIVSEIHLNGANKTIYNICCVNNSMGLPEESPYNRNRNDMNISPSFDRDFSIFNDSAINMGMNHYNCSDNIEDVSMNMVGMVSQFILDSNVSAGPYIVGNNGFALTVNETLYEFDLGNSKDVMHDIYTFLFKYNPNAFSLVKNTYHCNNHRQIFGINPIYLLEYEVNIADNFACYYTDKFFNSIFSNFFLTDCTPHQDYINTIFEDSYAICCNFSGICFGICNLTGFNTGVSAILFVEDENGGVIT
ncbi:hypothetical protein [Methanobrevibacter sp.]|uniref:hypothetical protein n=1 Tax=Methanobrevibacter sp. TaxID=66852 RepID=UPI00388EC32F